MGGNDDEPSRGGFSRAQQPQHGIAQRARQEKARAGRFLVAMEGHGAQLLDDTKQRQPVASDHQGPVQCSVSVSGKCRWRG
jgi:5'-3' exonuclease